MTSEGSFKSPSTAAPEFHPVGHVPIEDQLRDSTPQVDWSQKMSSCWCGCYSYLLQLVLVASMGSFLFGFNLGLLNTCINYISWELKWCEWDSTTEAIEITGCTRNTNYTAFISTAVFLGAAVGSMTGGSFLAYGRRTMMLISMVVFVFGTVSSCCANSFSALLWARLVCGYAVGLVSVCSPTYMSEVTPAAVRGKYGVFHQLFVTVGILLSGLLGLPIALTDAIPTRSDDDPLAPLPNLTTFSRIWWRVMLGLCIIPVILCTYLVGCVYKFDTPHFYIEKNQIADAEQLLKRIYGRDDVSSELRAVSEEIEQSEASKAAGMTLSQAWSSRADYRKVILFGCVCSAFQQLSGINVFIASSNALFIDAGLEGHWPTIMTSIMSLVNCVMTLPAVFLIEKLGRRTLMVMGTAGMTIGVAPAAICYWVLEEGSTITQYLAIVGCLVYIVFFAITYGPILWVYLFEIYPMEIKNAAAGLATAVNWVAGIAMVFVTSYLDNKISYLLFTIMSGISFVVVFMFMLETKGRTLGDSPWISKN